ncbi:MAG: DUF4276 family protein [Arcobacter sp.]|uniref:DUF4276 family protein n=1 Tax=Arcobacter sp. TaxID=1872629 RepID=UPI003D0045B6
MIRIAISVEGQTENEFCKKVLTPFFRTHNIEMTPIIIATSKDKCGRKHKGGCVNIDRIKSEIEKLLPNYDYVTTFYDFYGFSNRPTNNIDELERIIFELFSDRKFMPYIQKYEFETLLFSKPEYFEEYFGNDKISKAMKIMIDEKIDIELINDSPHTAPHKRLEQLFEIENERYDKVFHGEGIAHDIGLSEIRNNAKRFNNWIEKLLEFSNI